MNNFPNYQSASLCDNDFDLDIFQTPPTPIANSTMLEEPQGSDDGELVDTGPPLLTALPLSGSTGLPPAGMEHHPVARPPAPPVGMERGLKVGPHAYAYIVDDIWPYANSELLSDHSLLATYAAVRRTCLPNYLSARISIPSNIKCDAWDYLLADYHDAEIVDYLRFGWPGGYTAPIPPTPSETNHRSATNYPNDITRFLEKEVRLGAMLGPFPAPPFAPWSPS